MKKELINYLIKNKDIEYKNFISKLIPNLDKGNYCGVRTPVLKYITKEIIKNKKKKVFK